MRRSLRRRVRRSVFHERQPRNAVLDQTPAPGERVRRRSVVSVVLSRGAAPPPPGSAAQPAPPPQEAQPPQDDKKQGGAKDEPKKEDEAKAQIEVPDLHGRRHHRRPAHSATPVPIAGLAGSRKAPGTRPARPRGRRYTAAMNVRPSTSGPRPPITVPSSSRTRSPSIFT